MTHTADIIIIGGGPGGYVAAIRAAQLGFSVMCVDAKATLGGTCLNEGCIPSKALLHSSHLYQETQHMAAHGIELGKISLNLTQLMARKATVVKELTQGIDFLFRKNKITRVVGKACLTGSQMVEIELSEGKEKTQTWQAKRAVILATGSESIEFPGVTVDEERIISSRGALSLKTVPKEMVVLGGGYIGLEMGSVWSRLGSQVTVIERASRLVPAMDTDLSQGLEKALTRQGMRFLLSQTVMKITQAGKKVTLHLEGAKEPQILETDVLLISLGRKPFTQGLGLETQNIKTDDRGRIVVNPRFETTCPGIYAIGDVIAGPMLAHKAGDEGVALVEMLAGQAGHVNYAVIPSVVYTHPQAASVGLSEEEVKNLSLPYVVGKFPFAANSRAKAVGESEGFIKVLAHKETDRVLGVHILGPDAETLIGEAALAMEFGASAEDIVRTCHAHPTYSEGLREAAMAVSGHAIHI